VKLKEKSDDKSLVSLLEARLDESLKDAKRHYDSFVSVRN
jgi:hypothetical protein